MLSNTFLVKSGSLIIEITKLQEKNVYEHSSSRLPVKNRSSLCFVYYVCFLTQDHGDGLHQVENRLFMSHLSGVLRHLLALVPHVYKDPGVDGQHDGEGQQVENGPEHQVAAAVHGCHGGAVLQVTQAVPAHGGNQTHDYGHQPDEQHDDENTPGAHLTVQLHVEDGLVALHGHSQEIED